MNVFIHEFKQKRKSTMLWSLSLSIFIIFYMTFYPAMTKDGALFDSVMKSFPKEMLLALGLSNQLSFASLMGYFALTFSMIQLALAILSSIYGISILTEEERDLTADFLLSKPVSRSTIYFSKFFSALLSLVIVCIIVGLTSLIALEIFSGNKSYDINAVLKLLIIIPVFQLFFLSLSMLISLLFKKVRSVLSLAMGLAITLYVTNSVNNIIDSKILGLFTPFHYFSASYILKENTYNLSLLFIAIIIIIVSLVASFKIYIDKDFQAL